VRIGDVTNPDAISWYRQLGGGVTAVNNLHGSANPIGGQNQVNKNRWGVANPDDMHFEGAKPGIKFALGENVKRSRSTTNTRYPDTRMGVESFIRDRFTAAREYAAAMKTESPPRRDLELECLAEILAGERLVHCHSYRQDEILMLARLSAEFGFQLGTYQHGLECYKVADAVRESARGASLFSDWWAYKIEVQDAIPQAGPILHEQGVVVSFNSDSDELARRMNVEAAKAVKYGGLRPEEALKFVTINPAIQLDVASRVGSLEEGKDADFAIWSGDPLSSLSRCEATFVDGRELFSLEKDAEHRKRIASERQRLIQKVMNEGRRPEARPSGEGAAPAGGGGPPGGGRRRPPSEADAIREYYMSKLQRGLDADAHVCGECGLGLEHAAEGGAR
jgi:N-acetylglucosamine-6-phosphate deacetylase